MVNYFNNDSYEWFADRIALSSLAREVGTPCYVYLKQAILDNWWSFEKAFQGYPHKINYAVKANSNLSVLNIFKQLNSGFDIVSYGELQRLLKINCSPQKIVFSGVGKTTEELEAVTKLGIDCINLESKEELFKLNDIAVRLATKINIAFRVNPDVDVGTHPYITTGIKHNKFGVSIKEARGLYKIAKKLSGVKIKGISFHIGSQILNLTPFSIAIERVLLLINNLQKDSIWLEHVNVGGGLGVCYQPVPVSAYNKLQLIPNITEYVELLLSKLNTTNLKIYIEPGRSLVANAGILLTTVKYIKPAASNKYFAIIDAGMNDLCRPSLYGAWHDILPVKCKLNSVSVRCFDIVGPVCESGDFLGKDRNLSLEVNDILMINTVGAYGFSMSSNYNTRPKPAEVMVDGDKYKIVRNREEVKDLFALESI